MARENGLTGGRGAFVFVFGFGRQSDVDKAESSVEEIFVYGMQANVGEISQSAREEDVEVFRASQKARE